VTVSTAHARDDVDVAAADPSWVAGGRPPWLVAVLAAVADRVSETRARWSDLGRPGTVHDYVDNVLMSPAAAAPVPSAALEALASDPRLGRLARAYGLSDRDTEWLALLAACQLDPRLTHVLGYLDDEPGAVEPSPAVAAALWDWPAGFWPGPSSPLVGFGVAGPLGGEDWRPTVAWSLEPDVTAFLSGAGDWWTWWPGLELPTAPAASCLYPDQLTSMTEAVAAMDGGALVVEVVAPVGSGRRTLLRQLCHAVGRRPVVAAGASEHRVRRAALLADAVAVFEVAEDADEPAADDRPGALTLLARQVPGRGGARGAGLPGARPVARASFTLPALSRRDRLTLWSTLSGGAPTPPAIASWTLTPADVAAAAAAAPMGPAAATAVCRRRLGELSGALLSALSCPYRWDDLVVPDDVGRQLRALEDQVRLTPEVMDDWGMARLSPNNRGTAALFAGPSGTGKTMAAQILARSLDLDIYRVDLAQVVNKYIGETEKRLAQLFERAERSNVIIFFDEADALFGQRTKVKDAHDRYANIEIDYLLQRIESFDGVAILATNRKGDLDPGFLRRLRLIIDFRTPTPDERLRLWQIALPPSTPSGEPLTAGVDHGWLAEHLELTGAEIKVVALNAAFAARAAGHLVAQADVLGAARQELAKHGLVLRAESVARPAGAVAAR